MQVTWRIANLERTLPSGVVFAVHYTIDAVDGEYSSGAYGSIGVAGDPNQKNFVAFENLTKETVIQWVKDQLGADKIVEIEAALAGQIEAKKNPKSATGLPWSESNGESV
jgi:hypothetical protein